MRVKRARAFSYKFLVMYWFEAVSLALPLCDVTLQSSSTKSLVADESSRWLNVLWIAGYVYDPPSPKNPTVVTMG